MDKADCSGINEIVKVSEEIAINEMKGLSFSPLKNPIDTEMTKEKICNFITKAKEAKCNVTPEMIAQYSPISYTSAPGPNLNNSVSSPSLSSAKPTPGSGDVLVACKIGDNPPIQLNPSACVNVKGEILGAETLSCILGSNPPIKLSPDLCLKGGGRVTN